MALALLIEADQHGWLLVPASDDLVDYDNQSFLVAYVIDGDTIEIAQPDLHAKKPTTRVRFWGIDCPEMGHNGRKAQTWAVEATEFTRMACAGKHVTLHLETQRLRDVYDRLLAFVTLEDGEDLNEALVRAGFAHADERWPHSRLEAYRAAEDGARAKHAGLWSDGPRPGDPRNSPNPSEGN